MEESSRSASNKDAEKKEKLFARPAARKTKRLWQSKRRKGMQGLGRYKSGQAASLPSLSVVCKVN